MKNLQWFHSLNKPTLAPSDSVFTPVWSILYVLIFASFIVYLAETHSGRRLLPILIFCAQLVLNFSWTPIFFGLKNISLAFFVICILWVLIIINIVLFYKGSKLAAFLLIPYLLWVTFAVYLNWGYMHLN